MEQNEIQEIINGIIVKTENAIRKVYATQQESVTEAITSNSVTDQDSRIIFPKYSRNNKTNGGKIRISEQELRFIFVEQIKNLYYSIETPTYYTYKSARDKQEPNIGGSMSGKIDLTLYSEPNPDKPIAFIEFKYGSLSKNDTEKKLNRELKYDFIKLVADPEDELPSITYFLMGSLAGAGMDEVRLIIIPIVISIIPVLLLSWRMNILSLPEEEALSLGVNTRLIRGIAIASATLMTASTVAVAGVIGWVGLVIPHITRMITGTDSRKTIPASIILGAAFLTAVDTVSRSATYSEIPIGILTSFIGAPFFLYLIIKEGRKNEA